MTLTMEEKLKMWKAVRGGRCSPSTLGRDQLQGNGKENESSSCVSGSTEGGSARISVKCREFVSAKRQLEPISPSDANVARERGLSGLSIIKKRPKSSFVNSAAGAEAGAITTKVRRSIHSAENMGDLSSFPYQVLEKSIKANDGRSYAAGVHHGAHETSSPLRLATPQPSRDDCLKGKRAQICQSEASSPVNEILCQTFRNDVQTPRPIIMGPSLSNKIGLTAGYSDVSTQTTSITEKAAAQERKEAAVQTMALDEEVATLKRKAEAMNFKAEVAEQRAREAELRVKQLEETTICSIEIENIKKTHKEQMQDLRWAHMNEIDSLESTIDESNKMVKQLKEGLELAMSNNSVLQDKLEQIYSGTTTSGEDNSHTQ